MGKTVTKSLNGNNLQEMTKVNTDLYMKNDPSGLSNPPTGLNTCTCLLLAHLRQRLIGKLRVYAGARCQLSVQHFQTTPIHILYILGQIKTPLCIDPF